jgi:hypothetical protein
MLCVSCGTKPGLPRGPVDGNATFAPMADASLMNAGADDARSNDLGGGTDFRQRPDTADMADSMGECSPVSATWMPEPEVAMCPPSASPAACAGGDVGAVVARNGACLDSWGAIPFQCIMWRAPTASEEIVVLEVADCTDSVEISSAIVCRDRIEIAYVDSGTCQTCDGKRSKLRAFKLPLDARPVVVTGRSIEPPCLPPAGGTTGTGGTGGTGGATGIGGTTASSGMGSGGATASSTGVDGGCAQSPIDTTRASVAFSDYLGRATSPSIQAEEKTVPGLWDEIHAQLFSGKVYADDHSVSSECSFIYRNCALTMLTDNCTWFGPVASGVATQGAFYYSWGSGSGVYRSRFGKLAPSGDGLVKTISGEYFNPSLGPPTLVVALENGQLRVYRANVYWGKFNDWQDPEFMGTLKDFGDRLAIVHSNGQELPSTLP